MSAAFDVPLADLTRPGPARVRPRTESLRRVAKRDLRDGAEEYPEQPGVDYMRPRTLAECESVGLGDITPCPFVSCAHHLALNVEELSIQRVWPDREVWELAATCALREADHGGLTLDGVAARTNVTRERVRQIENRFLGLLRVALVDELGADGVQAMLEGLDDAEDRRSAMDAQYPGDPLPRGRR